MRLNLNDGEPKIAGAERTLPSVPCFTSLCSKSDPFGAGSCVAVGKRLVAARDVRRIQRKKVISGKLLFMMNVTKCQV